MSATNIQPNQTGPQTNEPKNPFYESPNIPLTIQGTFYPKLKTVSLDTLTATVDDDNKATVKFQNGSLVDRGDQTNANQESQLLEAIGTSMPTVFSNGDKDLQYRIANNVDRKPYLTPERKDAIKSFLYNTATGNWFTATKPVTNSKPVAATQDLLGIGDFSQSATSPSVNSTTSPMHNTGGRTRRYRIRKRKTVNKRRMRKSKKSRR